MEKDQISSKHKSANNVSCRVYGTPTIEELQRRVEVRQQEKKKKANRNKQ